MYLPHPVITHERGGSDCMSFGTPERWEILLPDPTSSWLFKPINSRFLSKDAMFDEHPSHCALWPKLFFSLTEELSPKRCQSQDMGQILVSILFSVLCQKVGTPH